MSEGERIAKRLARAGLCSRREAERWIEEGRVAVNNEVLTSPAVAVTASDLITVDGKPLPEAERPRLFRYHKPPQLLTTHRDPQGRPTVFDNLPKELPRLISVGRLDFGSEGLLLLTNDGELARKMELPSTAWLRRYRVRVHGVVDAVKLAQLENGVRVEGVDYGPIKAVIDRQMPTNAWLTVGLREGKNREIRRIMQYLGYPVTRLLRVAYGPFQLGDLAPGQIEEVPPKILRDQLGVDAGKSSEEKRAERTKRETQAQTTAREENEKAFRPAKPSAKRALKLVEGDRRKRSGGPAKGPGTGAPKGPGKAPGKPAGKPSANRRRPS